MVIGTGEGERGGGGGGAAEPHPGREQSCVSKEPSGLSHMHLAAWLLW